MSEKSMDGKKYVQVQRDLEKNKLYARPMFPLDSQEIDPGTRQPRLRDYDAWIVCHYDAAKLLNSVIDKLFNTHTPPWTIQRLAKN